MFVFIITFSLKKIIVIGHRHSIYLIYSTSKGPTWIRMHFQIIITEHISHSIYLCAVITILTTKKTMIILDIDEYVKLCIFMYLKIVFLHVT